MINAIKWEIIVSIKSSMADKINFISELLIFSISYLIILFTGANYGFMRYYKVDIDSSRLMILIGFIAWQIGVQCLGYSSSIINHDAKTGILEMRMLSKYSYTILLLFKVLIYLLFNFFILLTTLLITIFLFKINIKQILHFLIAFIVVLPSIFGMFGIGLIFGGITLKVKNVNQFLVLIQGFLLFITNTISPTTSIFTNIIPFVKGISIARDIFLGLPLPLVTFGIYFLINIAWFILGKTIFHLYLNNEKKNGSFDSY